MIDYMVVANNKKIRSLPQMQHNQLIYSKFQKIKKLLLSFLN